MYIWNFFNFAVQAHIFLKTFWFIIRLLLRDFVKSMHVERLSISKYDKRENIHRLR